MTISNIDKFTGQRFKQNASSEIDHKYTHLQHFKHCTRLHISIMHCVQANTLQNVFKRSLCLPLCEIGCADH